LKNISPPAFRGEAQRRRERGKVDRRKKREGAKNCGYPSSHLLFGHREEKRKRGIEPSYIFPFCRTEKMIVSTRGGGGQGSAGPTSEGGGGRRRENRLRRGSKMKREGKKVGSLL